MITKREPYYIPAFQDAFFYDQVPGSVLESLNENYTAPPVVRSAEAEQRSEMLAGNLYKLKDHIILGTDAGAVGDRCAAVRSSRSTSIMLTPSWNNDVELGDEKRPGRTAVAIRIAAIARIQRALLACHHPSELLLPDDLHTLGHVGAILRPAAVGLGA